jgi:hypothetical protein
MITTKKDGKRPLDSTGTAADDPLGRLRQTPAFRAACWCLGVLGLAAGAHLTLRRSSNLVTVWWIPEFVGRWTDRHGQLRNLPAYFMLGCPYMAVLGTLRARVAALLLLGLFGTALECCQLFIPTRWFDLVDIWLSWAGLIAAWAAFEVLRLCLAAAQARGVGGASGEGRGS